MRLQAPAGKTLTIPQVVWIVLRCVTVWIILRYIILFHVSLSEHTHDVLWVFLRYNEPTGTDLKFKNKQDALVVLGHFLDTPTISYIFHLSLAEKYILFFRIARLGIKLKMSVSPFLNKSG